MGENLMSETNRVGSGKGKTKYVLGSVGEREVKVNKKETKTEIEATNQLASVM